MIIEPYRPGDLPGIMRVAQAVGWGNNPQTYRIQLSWEPEGFYVARHKDEIIGMVGCTSYALSGWIGYLAVVPRFQRLGVGTRLMRQAIDYITKVKGLSTIRLAATDQGYPLYLKLGFTPEFDYVRWDKEPAPFFERLRGALRLGFGTDARPLGITEWMPSLLGSSPDRSFCRYLLGGYRCVPLNTIPLSQVVELDAASFGDRRNKVISRLYDCFAASSLGLLDPMGRLAAFAIIVPKGLVGPAEGVPEAMPALVHAICERLKAGEAQLVVPQRNQHALELLAKYGVKPSTYRCTRMMLGSGAAPGSIPMMLSSASLAIG